MRNAPLAAADAVEWASRRIDLAVLGAFLPATFVGVYYVAQQYAKAQAKLKTSFEPVLARQSRARSQRTTRSVAKEVAGHLLDHRGTAGIAWHSAESLGEVSWASSDQVSPAARRPRLPAGCGGDRRNCSRERSSANLRRANEKYGHQPDHDRARGSARGCAHHNHAPATPAAEIPGNRPCDGVVCRACLLFHRLKRACSAANSESACQDGAGTCFGLPRRASS